MQHVKILLSWMKGTKITSPLHPDRHQEGPEFAGPKSVLRKSETR
jgi:hypothetical protein